MESFGTLDYIVFVLTIICSLGIGVFYAFKGQHQRTTSEFLLADREMSCAPVSLSLLVTIMSAITVLGVPASIFQYGTSYWGFSLSYFIFIPVLAHLIMPVLYDMRLTSAYEYLEVRFDKHVKLCGTLSYVLMMTVYMGVAVYAPALALNAITGFDVWLTVIGLCSTCALYTTIGGMKAVIWTDVFQAAVMLITQVLVMCLGFANLGGPSKVFDIAFENHKIAPMNFEPSPFIVHSFWSVTIGGTFLCLNIYGTNQSAVQRFLCCKSKKEAKMMIYMNLPLLHLVMILGCMIGLVMFAEFQCDNPLAKYGKSDQLLIYYVVHVLKGNIGLSGLFVGCLFAASLSTISSSFNSLSTVTLQDLIKPYIKMSDARATVVAKFLVFAYACICLCMAVLASQVESMLKAALSILGIMGGPLLSMFIIGMCCRYVNSKGMLAGFTASFITIFCIGYGSLAYKLLHKSTPPKPAAVLGINCPVHAILNTTLGSDNTTSLPVTESLIGTTVVPPANELYTGFSMMFKLSYMWYSFLSFFVSFIVSSIVSLITRSQEDVVDEATLIPWFRVQSNPPPATECNVKSSRESLLMVKVEGGNN